MKKAIFLLTLFSLFIMYNGYSSHNKGGEITYKHISGYTYEITVTTYTKESSPADRNYLEISWGDNSSDFVNRVNGPDIAPADGYPDGEIIGNNTKYNIYIGNHTFPGLGIYAISLEDANRNIEVVNMPDPFNTPFYIETILAVLVPQQYCVNNSVYFADIPIMIAQQGKTFTHNPAVIDIDGDSLFFKLVHCKGENGQDIPGYTFPDSLEINPINGEITWTTPQIIGATYNIAVEITKWRQGSSPLKIGIVTRDFQIQVIDTVNSTYAFKGTSTWSVDINGNYVDSVLPGDTFELTVVYKDIVGVPLDLSGYGEIFEISNPATNTTVVAVDSIISTIQWIPDSTASRNHPYIITFRGTSSTSPSMQIQNDLTFMLYVDGNNQDTCPDVIQIPNNIRKQIKNNYEVIISPNPFHSIAQILIKGNNFVDSELIFIIYDLFGREVKRIEQLVTTNTIEFSRDNLASGMYLYKLFLKNSSTTFFDNVENITTGKIIVE